MKPLDRHVPLTQVMFTSDEEERGKVFFYSWCNFFLFFQKKIQNNSWWTILPTDIKTQNVATCVDLPKSCSRLVRSCSLLSTIFKKSLSLFKQNKWKQTAWCSTLQNDNLPIKIRPKMKKSYTLYKERKCTDFVLALPFIPVNCLKDQRNGGLLRKNFCCYLYINPVDHFRKLNKT